MTVNASDAEVAVGESTSSACKTNLLKRTKAKIYLDADPTTFFPPPVLGPDNTFDPPDWFLAAMSSIAMTTQAAPGRPPSSLPARLRPRRRTLKL